MKAAGEHLMAARCVHSVI